MWEGFAPPKLLYMSKNIVLDLDGVIADIASSIDEYLSKNCKDNVDYSTWLTTEHHCELSDTIMGNSAFWKNIKPFEDAWYQVNNWSSLNYNVYIVTARRTKASMSITEQWLDSWRINTMRPIFCKMGEKHNIVRELNPIFMVEDNPNEVQTLIKDGIKTYLRRAWYNEKYWNALPTIGSLLELKLDD